MKKGLDRDKVETTLEGIFQVWDTVFVSPMSILSYALYSAGIWAIEFMKLWLVLHFLGAPVDVATVLFVYPVSIVAGIITILPFSRAWSASPALRYSARSRVCWRSRSVRTDTYAWSSLRSDSCSSIPADC